MRSALKTNTEKGAGARQWFLESNFWLMEILAVKGELSRKIWSQNDYKDLDESIQMA